MTDATIDATTFAELQDAAGSDFVAELIATFLEEAAGVADGFVGVPLVRHEGHVGDDDGLRCGADDGAGVVEDVVHGDGDSALVAEDDAADGIADENDRDAGLLDQPGGWVVVGGDHGETPAFCLPFAELVDRVARHRSLPRHRVGERSTGEGILGRRARIA